MIICCLSLTTSVHWDRPCFRAVSVMSADTSCFSCDPVIPVQTPSVVYSEMSSVFTFTPSLPVCFQHYSTCCTYCIVLPYCSIQPREVIGRVTCEVIVSREKINADWSRHDLLSEARATEAPAKASFFKWERGLFNSCVSSQPGRQWRGKRDKRKQMQNREDLLNENLRMGLILKGLKSIEQKVQTHAMLIYLV